MQDRYRLPRTVVPSRYDLVLEPDLEAATFSGSVEIAIEAHERIEQITVNALDLAIDRAGLRNDAGAEIGVAEVTLDEELQRATLTLETPASPGPWIVSLAFRGELNDQLHGFYRSTYSDDEGTHTIATTQFEAADARRAFPCWDEPDLKAVFGVTLVVPDGVIALSNGPEIDRAPNGDGRVRVRFADTMSMSTYLVAFVVGRLEITDPVDVDGVPLRIVHLPGKGHLTAFALEAGVYSLRFFTDYYGIAYPDRKVDFVALPDFAQGAMENTGLITYRESLLLVDPEHATQPELENIADVVAHELAHQWFGNLVTMRWWNGIWLNEAFATFMALLTIDAWRPDWERWSNFGRYNTSAKEVDALRSTRAIEYPVHSPDDASGMFDVLTYQKGAAILRMLEQYLGPERFREGIRLYLTRHEYGNTETHDLWHEIEEASGEPVRRIMDQWIWQGGYPLLTASPDDGAVRLEQQRFLADGGTDHTTWDVPLRVRSLGGDVESVLVPADGANAGRADDDAVVVNAGASSFVRVRYEASLLDALIDRQSRAHAARAVRARRRPLGGGHLGGGARLGVRVGGVAVRRRERPRRLAGAAAGTRVVRPLPRGRAARTLPAFRAPAGGPGHGSPRLGGRRGRAGPRPGAARRVAAGPRRAGRRSQRGSRRAGIRARGEGRQAGRRCARRRRGERRGGQRRRRRLRALLDGISRVAHAPGAVPVPVRAAGIP